MYGGNSMASSRKKIEQKLAEASAAAKTASEQGNTTSEGPLQNPSNETVVITGETIEVGEITRGGTIEGESAIIEPAPIKRGLPLPLPFFQDHPDEKEPYERDVYGPWKGYRLKEMFLGILGAPRYSDAFKVHVSLDQSKIKIASEIILGILTENKVHHFKLMHEPCQERNAMGKEVVIYLQIKHDNEKDVPEENNPTFWIDLFNKLENALLKEGIEPNQFRAQGDKLFPGSHGFISYRNSENILKRYITADDLAKAGFTSGEACNLCPPGHDIIENFFRDDKRRQLILHVGQEIKKEESAPKNVNHDRTLIVPLKFPNDLAQQKEELMKIYRLNVSRPNDNGYVFFGNPDPKQNPSRDLRKDIKFELFDHIFQVVFYDRQGLRVDLSEYKKISDPLKDFLDGCLLEAAEYVVKAKTCLNASNIPLPDMKEISIIPAIYNKFFTPIIAKWIDAVTDAAFTADFFMRQATFTIKEKDPFLCAISTIDRNAFIREIFKCTFRDMKEKPVKVKKLESGEVEQVEQKVEQVEIGLKQIDFDSPVYVASLSDEELNNLFKQLVPINSLNATQQKAAGTESETQSQDQRAANAEAKKESETPGASPPRLGR